MRGRVGVGCVYGLERLPLLLFLVQLADDLLNAILVPDRFVEVKLDFWNAPQLQPVAHAPPEKSGRALERLGGLPPGRVIAERRVIDARQLQIWRDLHPCQRDEADPRVVHSATGEQLAQLLPDLVGDSIWPESHVVYAVTATLSIENTSITSPTLMSL